MALTRYTKQYRDKNDANITVTGATFELDNPADKWGGLSAATYEETEQYKLDIADFPGGFRLNPYSIPYYYDKGYHFNVMEYTSKGTGKSFSEFIESCASILREKIVAGNTGEWKSSQYSDLCSKDQTTLKSYSSNYCGHIELKLYILVNKVVAASTAIPEHREVNAGIEFFYGSSTWNSSGNRWNNLEGNTIRFTSLRMNNVSRPSEGGTTEIDYMLSQLPAMALSIKDCYLSPGPNNVYTESSGLITFNSVVKNQERWYLYAKGHPMMNQSDVPFLISGWDIGRIGTPNWIEDGEVDPEDPWIEPDPYDPVPNPPKPPGPTPDPTPIEDPIPIPALPPISGANVGIYKAFVPNSSQLRDIALKLWDPTAIEMIKQMFTNPMEAILGLAIVPVNPVQGSPQPVYLGRYNTQVTVPVKRWLI